METPEHHTHLLDQHEAWQRETIRRYGWALRSVPADDDDSPPYVHTVGLTGFRHPELILFATSESIAAGVLNDLGELVRGGRTLEPGEQVRLPQGSVHLLSFPASDGWLFAANDLYRHPGGPPVPALLVMPDEDLVDA
jgi:hypothetical protein